MSYLIPSQTRAVVFDLNGTMVRDGRYQRQAFEHFFEHHGVPLTEDIYQEKVANRLNKEIWPIALGRDVTDKESGDFLQEKEHLYEESYVGRVIEVSGLSDLIRNLKDSGIKLAVATSAFRESAEFVLQNLGLLESFDVILTGNEIVRGKPDPDIYQRTLERLGVLPADTLAFEDSPQGIRAAVAAGIPTIAVVGDYPLRELIPLGILLSINDFLEVRIGPS